MRFFLTTLSAFDYVLNQSFNLTVCPKLYWPIMPIGIGTQDMIILERRHPDDDASDDTTQTT
jgi:hypothetical protein